MSPEELSDPVVRAVVIAMRDGDRDAFYSAFAPGAVLTDDGIPRDLRDWAEREVFQAHGHVEPRTEGQNGHYLLGHFRSDEWSFPETYWRFRVSGGRVTRLDLGQA